MNGRPRGHLPTVPCIRVDDRRLPSRKTEWADPRTATGPFPFLSEHRLDHYADGTTTWLVVGPDYLAGGQPETAIAYAPVGVAYP